MNQENKDKELSNIIGKEEQLGMDYIHLVINCSRKRESLEEQYRKTLIVKKYIEIISSTSILISLVV